MKPINLTFSGLRSYRSHQEIDFTEVSMMAMIGNTGSGKSSILEGIHFALYGTCTWDGKNSKDLIAHDGDGILRVAFTFTAKKRTLRVTRAIATGPYPPGSAQARGLYLRRGL